jgi:hypothetical protein
MKRWVAGGAAQRSRDYSQFSVRVELFWFGSPSLKEKGLGVRPHRRTTLDIDPETALTSTWRLDDCKARVV